MPGKAAGNNSLAITMEEENDKTDDFSTSSCLGSEEDAASLFMLNYFGNQKFMAPLILIVLIVVGAGASCLFLTMGITSAENDQLMLFDSNAYQLVKEIETAFHDYKVAGQWVQEACSSSRRATPISRQEFRALYLNLISTGLEFQVASWNPNVTSAEERLALEEESRTFYAQEYPDLEYLGIRGLEPNGEGGFSVLPRSEQPFYFPVHLVEPIVGNENAIDFDLYSSASRRETIHRAIETWKPALTPRLQLVQETDSSAYSVILMHPGIPLSSNYSRPDSFSSIVIRIPDLLESASSFGEPTETTSVYIYDTYHSADDQQQFLGATTVHVSENGETYLEPLPELELSALREKHQKSKYREESIAIVSDQTWLIVIVALDGTYETDLVFIILAGALLFLLCVSLGLFVYVNFRRMQRIHELKAEAQKDRAVLVVENARSSARAERELNDFLAHEVRNPLAAAMSACSFVSSAVEGPTVMSEEERQSVREDIGIMDTSLHFINDLLRNMLDMHRASSKQLKIQERPTHLMNDVLRPVDSMLHRRGANYEVLLECPDNLVLLADPLRLKQIVLNLARNSAKFVDHGFIRLTAIVVDVDGHVQVCVEDSGPGIPLEKRQELFGRFQESLDSLNQGTGIGLSLCKKLTDLMGGRLHIDEDYRSGVPGCPGTRFVIDLFKSTPLEWDDVLLDKYAPPMGSNSREQDRRPAAADENRMLDISERTCASDTRPGRDDDGDGDDVDIDVETQLRVNLPEELSVLFVDDDMVLRKLFSRSVRKVSPGWTVHEASNGETALRLTQSTTFDLIFMDQYMASVQKQLLGTEATRALRAQGFKAKICGLSANDVEADFKEAGADSFMMKPFPCKAGALEKELVRIVNTSFFGRQSWSRCREIGGLSV